MGGDARLQINRRNHHISLREGCPPTRGVFAPAKRTLRRRRSQSQSWWWRKSPPSSASAPSGRKTTPFHFPRPGIPEREHIWRLAFPAEAPLGPDVDFPALANLDMTGASITGAARSAALLAAGPPATEISMTQIIQGIRRQYQRDQPPAAARGTRSVRCCYPGSRPWALKCRRHSTKRPASAGLHRRATCTASASAATVLSPRSLLGNSALKQRTATPPGAGPAQALLALQGAAGNRAVQRWAQNSSVQASTSRIHRAAQAGVTGPGERLPHHQAIQRSFGPAHDLSSVRAHVGGAAVRANQAMRATAFTTGEHVAFKAPPDLWLAAHEAAHVVQQRGGVNLHGGVGRAADPYERQADTVADRVASGRPAHDLLAGSRAAGRQAVQRCGGVIHEGCECAKEAMHAEETADHTATAVQRKSEGVSKVDEESFARRGGQITEVGSTLGDPGGVADSNEFILWNYHVGRPEPQIEHRRYLADKVVNRWPDLLRGDPGLKIAVIGGASSTGGAAITTPFLWRARSKSRQHWCPPVLRPGGS